MIEQEKRKPSNPSLDTSQTRVVSINRVSKVVKGGRRFSFSALVVSGNGKGKIGFGCGKANEVSEAIEKASRMAKQSEATCALKESRTIPHEVIGKFGAAKVIMIPAASGTGVIAGGAVRAMLESAGVKDILTKCIGTRNPHNAVRATLNGLKQLLTSTIEEGSSTQEEQKKKRPLKKESTQAKETLSPSEKSESHGQ